MANTQMRSGRSAATEWLSIQQVARRTGFSEPTLRYYEQVGLVGAVPRHRSSGHRRYPPELVQTIESLACMRTSGMPVADMRRYLELLPRGVESAAELEEMFAAHAARLGQEIARLRARRAYLTAKARLWRARADGDLGEEGAALDEVVRAPGLSAYVKSKTLAERAAVRASRARSSS